MKVWLQIQSKGTSLCTFLCVFSVAYTHTIISMWIAWIYLYLPLTELLLTSLFWYWTFLVSTRARLKRNCVNAIMKALRKHAYTTTVKNDSNQQGKPNLLLLCIPIGSQPFLVSFLLKQTWPFRFCQLVFVSVCEKPSYKYCILIQVKTSKLL